LTITAIAEELDTRQGFKAAIDNIQDSMAADGFSIGLSSHILADLGPGNVAVHNAQFLLKHFASDSRMTFRRTAPNLPFDNVAKWLVTDRGTAYAAAMHMRFYHDRYDALISRPLSQEEKLRMAVMFFRQGTNFDTRYAGQMEKLSKGGIKAPDVQGTMLDKHIIPAPLKGNTTPRIPQRGHGSYVADYGNKISQLQWVLAPPKK
jgi:hypothetical protein